MDQPDVDAQRFGHVAVEGAGPDLHAQPGARDQQVQAEGQQQANHRHEQAVGRVGEGVGQWQRPVQRLGDVHAVNVVAPQQRTQLFEHVDQAEGQQHLIQVVALVEMAEQQPFKRQAQSHRQQGPEHDGQRQAAHLRAEPPGQIGPEHVEAAMGEVDHAHDAEDQRQAGRQHEQQQAVLHAVEQLDQKVGKVHGGAGFEVGGPSDRIRCGAATSAASHP